MRQTVRKRPPVWVSYVMPARWWLASFGATFCVCFVALHIFGGPPWVFGGLLPLSSTLLAEAYWRRTRPPSADARWSALARSLYQQPPAG